MSIRNAAKALIINDGCLLLNKCSAPDGGVYYTLPGGGQNQYETMEEAVTRECLEETGYLVEPKRLAALYEEIITDKDLRKKDGDYTHKIFHVFRCGLKGSLPTVPSEQDSDQQESVWIPLERVGALRFFPELIQKNLAVMLKRRTPLYLGSQRTKTSICLPNMK